MQHVYCLFVFVVVMDTPGRVDCGVLRYALIIALQAIVIHKVKMIFGVRRGVRAKVTVKLDVRKRVKL